MPMKCKNPLRTGSLQTGTLDWNGHNMTIHQTARAVNLKNCAEPTADYNPLAGAAVVDWFKVYDRIAKQWRTRCAGYSNGVACSDRTRGGQFHADKSFNVACDLVDELQAKAYHTFLIRITWKRSGRTIHYAIQIDTIETVGEIVDMHDGAQWHIPLRYWSIDGAPPVGPEPTPEPVVEQIALFDIEPVQTWRGGAY